MTVIDHAPPEAEPEALPAHPASAERTAVVDVIERGEPIEPRRVPVTGELQRVSAVAAARVVAILATIVAAAWALGVVLLWLTADALGATSHLERLMRDLGFEGFRLASAPFFLGIALLGLVFVLACTVAALLATAAFNAVAHLTGGVPVTVVTDPAIGD